MKKDTERNLALLLLLHHSMVYKPIPQDAPYIFISRAYTNLVNNCMLIKKINEDKSIQYWLTQKGESYIESMLNIPESFMVEINVEGHPLENKTYWVSGITKKLELSFEDDNRE